MSADGQLEIHMSKPEVMIDIARLTDVPAVVDLARRRSLGKVDVGEASRRGFLVSDYDQAQYQELVERADHFYVAYCEGVLMGFVLAYSEDRIAPDEWLNLELTKSFHRFVVIKQVCVEETTARHGVASQLYQHVLSRSFGRPVVAAVVSEPRNLPSMGLHTKMGFEPSLTFRPPDGIPRVVWVRRQEKVDILLKQHEQAIDLYKHEDMLNWSKLNNFFYVTTALIAVLGFALGRDGADQKVAVLATASVGFAVATGFAVTLFAGIAYLHRRKDKVFELESYLCNVGGVPLMSTGDLPDRRLGSLLRRSPSSTVLRLFPALAAVAWLTVILIEVFLV